MALLNNVQEQTAEAVQRAEIERLQVAIQAANMGLWDWNLRTNHVTYSIEWKRQIGFADDEIGNDFTEWESRVHPDDLPRAKQVVLDYIAAPDAPYQQEFRFRHKDGSYRYILAQGLMYRDDEGKPDRMFGSHIDITQNKLAEIALRKSEARYRSLFENNHSVMLLIEPPSGRIVDANPAAATYYGWTRDQLRTMSIYAINTATPAETAAEMERARAEQRNHFLFNHRLADGSIRHVEVYSGPIEIGSQALLFSIVHDITERRQAEDALQLTKIERERLLEQLQDKAEQLSQIMRSVPEGVLVLDSAGFVRLANPRAEAILALLAAYDEEQRLASLGGARLNDLLTSPPAGQWHTLRAGGQIFEVIARPLESGPVLAGWVLVARDATAEHAVQAQLQRQERLAAVGQLAAGIAHDFNNIIAVITIYAELIGAAPELTEKDRARTTIIMNQAMRATRMIRQILDFSRQSVLERQTLDLLPLLKEQEKLLRQTLPENIEIEFAYAPGEYFVRADPARMQQLMMNLAVNARDAMPEGGRLRIELARCTFSAEVKPPLPDMRAGDWARINVQDTGTGIRPELLGRIFEPFFTTKEPGRGTGLGLAQAHGIVAQHEGHMYVTSAPGAGATFTIFLPVDMLQESFVSDAAVQLALPQGHGESVLIVEDDMALRGSLAELLGMLNYRVAQSPNGVEALDYLERSDVHVDVLISDIVMPRLGGIALVKTVRQRGMRMPIILMTGHPKGEDREGLREMEVYAWLDKPPSTQRLAQVLAGALAS